MTVLKALSLLLAVTCVTAIIRVNDRDAALEDLHQGGQVGVGGIFRYSMLDNDCLNQDYQEKIQKQLQARHDGRKFLIFDTNENFTTFQTYDFNADSKKSHYTMRIGTGSNEDSCLPWKNKDWKTTDGCKPYSEKIKSIQRVHNHLANGFMKAFEGFYEGLKQKGPFDDPAFQMKVVIIGKLRDTDSEKPKEDDPKKHEYLMIKSTRLLFGIRSSDTKEDRIKKIKKNPRKTDTVSYTRKNNDWVEELKTNVKNGMGLVMQKWSSNLPNFDPTDDESVNKAAKTLEKQASQVTLRYLGILRKQAVKNHRTMLSLGQDRKYKDITEQMLEKKLKKMEEYCKKRNQSFLTDYEKKIVKKQLGSAIAILAGMFTGSAISVDYQTMDPSGSVTNHINKILDAFINEQNKSPELKKYFAIPDFVVEMANEVQIMEGSLDEDYVTSANLAHYLYDATIGRFTRVIHSDLASKPYDALTEQQKADLDKDSFLKATIDQFKHVREKVVDYLKGKIKPADAQAQPANNEAQPQLIQPESHNNPAQDERHVSKIGDLKCMPLLYDTIGYNYERVENEDTLLNHNLEKKVHAQVIHDGEARSETVQPTCLRYAISQFYPWNKAGGNYQMDIKTGGFNNILAKFKNATGWKSSKVNSANRDIDRDTKKHHGKGERAIDIPSKCVVTQVYAGTNNANQVTSVNCRLFQWCVRKMVAELCPTQAEIEALNAPQSPQPAKVDTKKVDTKKVDTKKVDTKKKK